MRLTVTTTFCIIAITGSLLGAPVSNAQALKKTRMTISFDAGRLDKALNRFVEASHLPIAFNPAEMQRYNVPADLQFRGERADIILEKLLDNLPVSYRETESGIMIHVQPPGSHDRDRSPVSEPKLQALEVRGTVTDSTGFPMPGVSVTLKSRPSIGTSTDLNGKYILEIPADEQKAVLVFSIIGFETQEIPVEGREVVDVVIVESAAQLEDVVVVAFGKQKRTDMVGAVTSVNPSELKVPSSNLTTALAGRIAGMIAYQRSGEPGQDNADFFIRGVTTFGYKVDPLILIDNVEVSTTELARIQPDDIASFSIMKDATATALYGARGANGVILVTTKEGAEGKARISFRLENSLTTPTRNVELADPVTYMELHNEAIRTRSPDAPLMYSQWKIENTRNGANPIVFPATDWRKALFKDYSMNQRFNLNVSGGGKVARYYVAGSMNRDNGVLKVDGRNNFNNNINLTSYTLRSNVNVNLGKLTELVVRLNGNFDDYTGPIQGGKATYNMVMKTNPVLFPAFYPIDEDHSYLRHIMFGNYDEGQYLNPYAEMVRGYREYSRSRMLAQLELNQDFSFVTEGLAFRALMNTNRTSFFDVSRGYTPFYYSLSAYDPRTGEYRVDVIDENEGTEYLDYDEGPKEVSSVFYLESALSYNRVFNEKHGLSGMLVYIMRQNLTANAGSLQLSLPYRNLGLSGRATYAYDSRYFAEFNFGYNGSERFHKSKRFGFFPSGGLAWSISNEEFFKPLKKTITNLRLRATYGLVGNDAIGSAEDRFFYLSNVDMNAEGAEFGEEDNGYIRPGVTVTRYANEDITWETARKLNLALEVDLFDRLQFRVDYFKEHRYNILMTREFIPSSMGLSSEISANVGEAGGEGVDASVDYSQHFSNGMWMQARGNFTYATSEFKVYEEPSYNEWWASRIGYSVRQEWGYLAERLFVDEYEVANSPRQNFGEYMAGDIKYRDVNRDGQITILDMVPIGYPTVPEIVYGFGISAGYRNFDISAFFQGLARESFRIGVQETFPFAENRQLLKAYAEDHWSEENRNLYALWPRFSATYTDNNIQRSTWFQRDGTFLRLKQVEIGYSIPQQLAQKLRMANLRIYASGTNLLTWSKFKLWDVEMASNGLGYPVQRVFNLGIHVEL